MGFCLQPASVPYKIDFFSEQLTMYAFSKVERGDLGGGPCLGCMAAHAQFSVNRCTTDVQVECASLRERHVSHNERYGLVRYNIASPITAPIIKVS